MAGRAGKLKGLQGPLGKSEVLLDEEQPLARCKVQ